jgi:hypothetical protein
VTDAQADDATELGEVRASIDRMSVSPADRTAASVSRAERDSANSVSDARSEADAMGVDAWLTEDHTHVVKIAANRLPDK